MDRYELARDLLCAPYAIKADGTVFSADGTDPGWSGVAKISGDLALRWDGRVLTRGHHQERIKAVTAWRSVKDVCVCGPIEAALLDTGALTWLRSATVGQLTYGHCAPGWTDVEQFFLAFDPYSPEKSYADYAVGFREDGTVRVAYLGGGDDRSREIEVMLGSMGGVKKISEDCRALTRDGTVCHFATKNMGKREKGVFADFDLPADSGAAREEDCVLLADGTVRVPEGLYPGAEAWRGILCISRGFLPIETGRHILMALRADGQVLLAERYGNELADTSGWKLFDSLDTLPEELERAKERCLAEGERLDREEAEAARLKMVKRLTEERLYTRLALERLEKELTQTRGLFSGGKRKELTADIAGQKQRLAELEEQLAQCE